MRWEGTVGRQCRHRAGERRDLREDCEGGITLRAVLRIALCLWGGGLVGGGGVRAGQWSTEG